MKQPRMNLLERGVSLFSPRWALRRVQMRMALAYAVERFSNYEGARWDRRTSGWVSNNADANVVIGPDLLTLRNRSRELVRNNPWASKSIEELVSNTIGTGIIPQAQTGRVALDKKINAAWSEFADNCDPENQMDFYGMQAIQMRALAESGEALARFRQRRTSDGLTVPLQVQILEADYLDQSRTINTPGGGWVYYGVEFTPIGQRAAYWLYNHHPGSLLFINMGGTGGGVLLSKPVPAEEVMHIYRILRPGQVRGVPWMAPCMLGMRDLDDYLDAECVRKKIEACSVGAITSTEGAYGPSLGQVVTDPNSGQNIETFEPGMFYKLRPGQDVRFNDPKASGGFRDAVSVMGQRIAAGMNLPYELMSGDMSNVNYSSYRAGTLSFRATVEAYRWLTIVPLFCNPVWRRFVDTLVNSGTIDKPNYGVQWHAPRFESVDPVKDADAIKIQVRSGTKTLPQAIAEQGYDPDTHLKEIADTNKKLDDMRIVLDTDPRWTTIRGQAQPAGSGESDPTKDPASDPASVEQSQPAPGKKPPKPKSEPDNGDGDGEENNQSYVRGYGSRAYFRRKG